MGDCAVAHRRSRPCGPSLLRVSAAVAASINYRGARVSAVADKLREARALVERGWCQHVFDQTHGDQQLFCAVGAIVRVTRAVSCYLDVVGTLRQAVDPRGGLYGWNDAPERTQAEVLAAFDKAIELAEAQS
jgi:hypothetical protein